MKKRYLTLIATATLAGSALLLTSCGASTVDSNLSEYKEADKITSKADYDEKLKEVKEVEKQYIANMYNATTTDGVIEYTEKDYTYTYNYQCNAKSKILEQDLSNSAEKKYTISYDVDTGVKNYEYSYKTEKESADESDSIDSSFKYVGFTNVDLGIYVYVNTTLNCYSTSTYPYQLSSNNFLYCTTVGSYTAESPYNSVIDNATYDSTNDYYYSNSNGTVTITVVSTNDIKNEYYNEDATEIYQYIISANSITYKYSVEGTAEYQNASYSSNEYIEYTKTAADVTNAKVTYNTYPQLDWGYLMS